MHEHISPEEKLLKLIRKKDRRAPKEDHTVKEKSNSSNISQKNSIKNEEGRRVFVVLNKFLILVSIVLLIYIGYEFLFTHQDVNAILKEPESTSAPQWKEADLKVALPEPKPYTYYTVQIEKRDIFESPLFNKKADDIKAVTNIPELTKNLKLVGIVLDKTSEAIVEDLDAKETFFLHKGERIKDAVIDDIQENKIILLYGDQKVELVQ